MDPIAGGVLAGGASVLGGLFGSSAAKKRAKEQKDLWRQSLGLYGKFLNDPQNYLARGEGAMQSAIGSIQSGFKDAKLNLNMAGQNARRTAVTGGSQAAANTTQSMISRGLYGTTALDNAQRGISSDVSRRLSQIDEEVGSMMAGLSQSRGMAVGAAQQGLGQFYQGAYGQKQNALENYINLLRDKPMSYSGSAYFGNLLGGGAQQFAQVAALLQGMKDK